jgi:hypothetical protein
MTDEDRARLDRLRQGSAPKTRFDSKLTARLCLAGIGLGFVLAYGLHWGNPFAMGLVGAALGLPFDIVRSKKQNRELLATNKARWDAVYAGQVEHVVADASRAVRIDGFGQNSIWFLEVADRQILCVGHWAEATQHVEVDLVPGNPPTSLHVTWTGDKLSALRPPRRFKDGERKPRQCEVLDGTLDEVDTLLKWQEDGAETGPANAASGG